MQLFFQESPGSLALQQDNAALSLSSGQTLTVVLVVGADGRDSWVRQAAGLSATSSAYDEMGVVANFACEKPHRNVARQWFRQDGVLAWLPLPGNRLSMVWSTPDKQAEELLSLSGADLAVRVGEAGHGELGALETITTAAAFMFLPRRLPSALKFALQLRWTNASSSSLNSTFFTFNSSAMIHAVSSSIRRASAFAATSTARASG